ARTPCAGRSGLRTITDMRGLRALPTALLVTLGLAVPLALATPPAPVHPGERVDLRVLLLSADGTEAGFAAWQAELQREGVPFTAKAMFTGQTKTSTLTDADLADYANDHAKYEAVILATGDLGHNVQNTNGTVSFLSALTDPEWASLAKFERTFG